MSALNQKTIAKSFSLEGIGLHSGKNVSLNVLPAEPNTGIIFKRTDLKNNNTIVPSIFNVTNAVLCTTISNEFGVKVYTIEHLMGALFGMGIDNALVEINNEEVPILDGSAKNFITEIVKVGIKKSNTPIKVIKIKKKIEFKENTKKISIEPTNVSLDIDFEIKYKNALIGTQRNSVNVFEDDLTEIYNSRTFCLYEDVENLRKMGFGKGGSLDNAVVVKDDKILNESGLRNSKEFVNHKILDCMGDIYLCGYRVVGKILCKEGGHQLTNQLLRQVFQDDKNFSIIEIKEKVVPNWLINKIPLKSIA